MQSCYRSLNLQFMQKNEHARRSSSGKSLRSEASPSLKDNSTKLVNSSLALRLKLNNLDNVSSNPNNVNASNFNSSSSISVEKIPSSVKLSQLKEALSTFGKISKASMRSKPKKCGCCYIQFEVLFFFFVCPSLLSLFFLTWLSNKYVNLMLQECRILRESNICWCNCN